jgi:hypothetical protein
MSKILARNLWPGIAVLLLLALLLIGDWLCYQFPLSVIIDENDGFTNLQVGSQMLTLGQVGIPTRLELVPYDPVMHEYQIDGTDSTNNFTLDTTYLHSISTSLYYRFQAWMRDLDGTSRWRNVQIWNNQHLQQMIMWPANGATLPLPGTNSEFLALQLQRPETPRTLNLVMANRSVLHITLDRNDRTIDVTRDTPGSTSNQEIAHAFFPDDVLPFAAMVADFLLRTLIWAVLLLLTIYVGETLLALALAIWSSLMRRGMVDHALSGALPPEQGATNHINHVPTEERSTQSTPPERDTSDIVPLHHAFGSLTDKLHPIALAALGASLLFTAWIARVQYSGEPHIFDAAAYLFAAKIYAQGHLWAAIPPASDRFPGPFMVQFDGRWFAQYPPGTALTLVPGLWLGVPWLVEPVLGTLALLGIGLIAARLFDRRVATLAVLLGALSPFYSYLAASYMSHAIALFYLVWGTYALLRFVQRSSDWNMPLAAALFGMGVLTRDMVALLFVVLVIPGILLLHRQRLYKYWRRWLLPLAAFLAVALFFTMLDLGYNTLLTNNLLQEPRTLFFAGDHWGFGQGVGFYGQHTLAAGFVNLDELLTILAIDLFGWPFYCTLALLVLPFITRRALPANWLLLSCATIMTGAFIGYFYHGIYLGPRYLFETLPFLLILTAHGIITLMSIGKIHYLRIRSAVTGLSTPPQRPPRTLPGLILPGALVLSLVACNLLYYLPRQIQLYQNYAGLPANTPLDVAALYHPPLHHAIIVTNDYVLYQVDLFPLNDPDLHNDVIYAYASNPTDYQELANAFPTRTLYRLLVQSNGSIQYALIKNLPSLPVAKRATSP